MTLGITRTPRWAAIVTLLAFGAELSLPAAWAQLVMPASGAPATGAQAPVPKPSMPASGTGVEAERCSERPHGRGLTLRGREPETRPGRGGHGGGQTYTVYQRDRQWDGTRLSARAAVSIEARLADDTG
jgi:hypothetical protein